ncbi:Cytochrome P450 89A2 [Platanthera zijinensis]|uniref:Cytochrome P450 89A2 n=1 Tax=Platanthera zijinensis TaxID=2320716 RepID=A0AAP0B7R8_9ASPA
MTAALWAFLPLIAVFIFFTGKQHLRLIPVKKSKPPLPPVISVLPFLSQLFFRRFSLHEIEIILRRFHSLHGPILTLRLSPLTPPSIFISSSHLSHAALIHHADSFARRPPAVEPILFLTAGTHDISSSDYGPLWRFLRQNLSAETLHPSRLRSFARGRRWSVYLLLGDIRSHTGFQRAILSILALMCFGEKLGNREISEIDSLQSFLLSLFTSFNVFAVLPAVTKLLFYKRWKRIVFARQRQAEIFLPMIRARREKKQGTKDGDYDRCYVDSLIDLQLPVEGGRGLTDEEMVNLCHEFLSGAATTATALEWTMAEIVKQNGVQSKILAEIESLIGIEEEEIVKEEDLERMPYLKGVVMESLRRHPPSHFVLPHSVTEEFELNGYLIPNGAEVHFSVANVHWDRWNWEEPMEFRPERFLAGGEGEGVDLTGSRGIKMMPFGAGRRLCPGYKFAMLHLELLVANLVREFEWKAEAGEEVDLSENFEFTTVMKNPLRVHAVQRRKIQKKGTHHFCFQRGGKVHFCNLC